MNEILSNFGFGLMIGSLFVVIAVSAFKLIARHD